MATDWSFLRKPGFRWCSLRKNVYSSRFCQQPAISGSFKQGSCHHPSYWSKVSRCIYRDPVNIWRVSYSKSMVNINVIINVNIQWKSMSSHYLRYPVCIRGISMLWPMAFTSGNGGRFLLYLHSPSLKSEIIHLAMAQVLSPPWNCVYWLSPWWNVCPISWEKEPEFGWPLIPIFAEPTMWWNCHGSHGSALPVGNRFL